MWPPAPQRELTPPLCEKRPGGYMSNPLRYKTELCVHWKRHGQCALGVRCGFAHGLEELRVCPPWLVPPQILAGRKVCRQFAQTGFCVYGDACGFPHAKPPDMVLPPTPTTPPLECAPCDENAMVWEFSVLSFGEYKCDNNVEEKPCKLATEEEEAQDDDIDVALLASNGPPTPKRDPRHTKHAVHLRRKLDLVVDDSWVPVDW